MPGGNETVLVVEDNAEVRGVVVQQLQLLGYHVLQCEDAVAALVVLSEKRIDLLFSDIVMPGEVDGLKLARNAIAHWPSLKVLLTTGYGDVASRGDVRGLRVLEKPYRTADLAGALREALDRDKPAIH